MDLKQIFSDAIKKMIQNNDFDSLSNLLGAIALLTILNTDIKDGDKDDN